MGLEFFSLKDFMQILRFNLITENLWFINVQSYIQYIIELLINKFTTKVFNNFLKTNSSEVTLGLREFGDLKFLVMTRCQK